MPPLFFNIIRLYSNLATLNKNIQFIVDGNTGWKYQSGSTPPTVDVAPVDVVTIVVDTPIGGVGAVDVRGAEPPPVGAAIIFGDALVISSLTCTRNKVREFRAVTKEAPVVAGCPAHFVTGQQEDLQLRPFAPDSTEPLGTRPL